MCSALAVTDVEHHEEAGEGGTRGRDHQDGRGVWRWVSVVPVVVQNHTEEDQSSCKYNLCRVRKRGKNISLGSRIFVSEGEGEVGVTLWCHEVADTEGMGARQQCPPSPKEVGIKEIVADISIDFMFLPPPPSQPLDPLLPTIAPTHYLNFIFENPKKSRIISLHIRSM